MRSLRDLFTPSLLGSFLGLMLVITSISLTASAAAWDLDPGFGTGGKVIWSPNGNTESARGAGMALLPDGKIVMVGGSSEVIGGSRFLVVRFTSGGALDTTFGTNGVVTLTFGGTDEVAVAIAAQQDGKIVVGGYTALPGIDMAVARLNTNGSLDTTFGGTGKVTVNFQDAQGISQSDYLQVLKVAPDGKIVIAGGSPGTNNLYKTSVGRLNTNGSMDTTFSSDGRILNGLGTGRWDDLVTNSDGSIVLAGTSSGQFSSLITVAKYSNSGANEWEYNRSITPQCYMRLNGIAAQPDGKYVAVGSNEACKPVPIRINADGSLDASFTSTPYSLSGQLFAVAIQPDGKILATIGVGSEFSNGFSLIRYNSNGSIDTGFGTGGVATITMLNGHERAYDMVIQPDGKILVGGSASVSLTSGYRFAMARYRGTSAVPQDTFFDYDGDGKSDVSVFRASENKWYVLRSSDFGVTQQTFAIAGDIPVPADYDGDNRTDFAIYRPASGMWWYLSSINNAQVAAQWGGAPGDIPRPSDFDGDGKTDYVYFRPTDNFWYRASSANGAASNVQFGLAGDKPVIGDFDGDGKFDPTIFRPSSGDWWYLSSLNNAHVAAHWGASSDVPTPADFDGDGRTDLAVYRPSEGGWYIYNSATASATTLAFGTDGDRPVAADYDGDGKADIAVFRPSSGVWYLLQSTSAFVGVQFGISTDRPTPNSFVP